MASVNFEVLCQRAREAIEKRDWEKARQYYLQALGLKSDSPDVHYGLATVCFQLKDVRSAAHHFKEVTRLDPLRAGAYINLGAIYNLLDQLDEAILALRRGIQLDSHRGEGYYNLGLVHRRKGQNDMAIQAYQEAIRVNPRMADAHYNIANLYFERDQLSLAASHYQNALELRPNWDRALHGLENVESKQEAKQQAKQAKAHVPQPSPAAKPTAAAPPNVKIDPERTVDPNAHGPYLTVLHEQTIKSDEIIQEFFKFLESQLEPAIKELSSCLLYPDTSSAELEQSMERIDSAMRTIRSLQTKLKEPVELIREEGDRLVRHS